MFESLHYLNYLLGVVTNIKDMMLTSTKLEIAVESRCTVDYPFFCFSKFLC